MQLLIYGGAADDKKRLGIIIATVLILIVFFILFWMWIEWIGWETLNCEFNDDENGLLAEKIFPDYKSLPASINSEFEHRTDYCYRHGIYTTYESYYLKLYFESTSEYEQFLNKTEEDYSDMTKSQWKTYYITKARFYVGRYSFRAIDVSPFGPVNSYYVGLIAHSDSENTIVFLYFYDEMISWSIEDELSEFMPYYTELWGEEKDYGTGGPGDGSVSQSG